MMKNFKICMMVLLFVSVGTIAQAQQSAFQGSWISEIYPSYRIEISGNNWSQFSNNIIQAAGTAKFSVGRVELLLANGKTYYDFILLAPGLIERAGYDRYRLAQSSSNSQNAPQANNTAQSHYNKGIEYYKQNDFDSAIKELTDTIRLNPNFSQAFVFRGQLYYVKGNYEQAIIDCNQVIRLNPNSAGAYNQRGWYYYFLGNNEQAIIDTTEAIRIDPNLKEAYDSRGWAYLDKGDYIHAIADFEMALRIDPMLETSRLGLEMTRRAQSR